MKQIGLAWVFGSLLVVASTDEVTRLLGKYDDVKNTRKHGAFYRELFAACNEVDLNNLTAYKNDSIATQSAWEVVALTVPKEDGKKVYRPDSTKLAWFVGFFEGRHRIATPSWWFWMREPTAATTSTQENLMKAPTVVVKLRV